MGAAWESDDSGAEEAAACERVRAAAAASALTAEVFAAAVQQTAQAGRGMLLLINDHTV